MLKLLSKNKKIILISILSFVGGIIATSASHVLEKYIDTVFFNTTEKQYKISDTTEYFPLEEGNKWTYEGTYKGTYPNSNQTYSKNIVYTTEVTKVHKFKEITVAIINKSISDYSDEISTPSKFAYVIASNKVYSILDPNLIDEIIEKKHAYDILKEYKLIFEFPLSKGLRYGETMQIGRSDAGYIWHVEKVYNIKTQMVDKPSKAYFIAQRAVGWRETILFQPYLGILEHSYFHSGTVDEYSFKLVSFMTKSEVK